MAQFNHWLQTLLHSRYCTNRNSFHKSAKRPCHLPSLPSQCGRQLAEFATHVLYWLIWFQTLISISSRHSLWICYIITPGPRENSISFCSGLCCVYCLPACIRESCLASISARLCTICIYGLFFPSKLGPLNINTSYQFIYSTSPSQYTNICILFILKCKI